MSEGVGKTGLEIAVIGMAGRFPGAGNIHEFWDNLKNGTESISYFSDRELEEEGFDPGLIGSPAFVKARGLLEGMEYFDASFFDYTPGEARAMDPQVRLFHECAWEALENAGYDPGTYKGKVGVYAGASMHHFWQALSVLSDAAAGLDAFSASQLINKDYLTARISFKFNLRGPSFSVQTACSTSLVAIHLACQGLLSGECSMALAGGVTATVPRKNGYIYQEGMVLSADGHCRAFDAAANGFIDGNGVGVVILKLLEDAAADGDFIHAVIKGSAVNNDGGIKSGFTAPSVKAQAGVIRAALSMAEVEPESIGYVETHGTGTPLGDPIEIEALKRAFNTGKKGFCRIGSVKTNVGHLDSAAGAAGFIKAVLMLQNRQIPPSLFFKTPNPEIDFENSPFVVNNRLREWENGKYPLRAGVSSFGIGGTNAHVVLEAWSREQGARREEYRDYQLILLSAKTKPALDQITENLRNHLKNNPVNPANPVNPVQTLADIAYTLQVGRKPLNRRRMVVCTSMDEAAAGLSDLAEIPYHPVTGDKRRVVFMFAGLGSQYVDMGLELYQKKPAFREEMDRCFNILNSLLDYDIKEILYPGEVISHTGSPRRHTGSPRRGVNRIDISQVVVFIIEYALAKLLMKWGIKPHSMIGYSFGEYTAACLAGVFSLEDALKIIVCRGKLLRKVPGGAMFSVPLPASGAAPLLTRELSIAIDNGSSCIVAGPGAAVAAFEQEIKKKKLMGMPVPHSVAMHSKMMDPILAEFEKELEKIPLNPPQIPYISNLDGKWINAGEVVKPTYWSEHLRETVRFAGGLMELVKNPNSIFIEIGPGRDLGTMVKRFIEKEAGHRVLNLVRPSQKNDSDVYYLLNKIGYLWLYGVNIDWSAFYSRQRRCRIPLPTYPFEQQRYWVDTKIQRMILQMASGKTVTPVEVEISPAEDGAEAGETDTPISRRSGLSTTYIAPDSELEKTMVHIWQRFFGIAPIGTRDDFFELGGDSLKAMNVSTIIRKQLSVEIPVAEFFDRQTIQGLVDYIKANAEKRDAVSIDPVEKREYYPVSSVQRRLYLLQYMGVESITYNEPFAVVLEGDINKEKFENTFKRLIQRHESVRTSFEIAAGEPVQKIHDYAGIEFGIEYHDLAEPRPDIPSITNKFIRHFNLAKAPLWRAGLIRVEEKKHVLIVDMHHIITDGTSQTVLINDFVALYRGQELPELSIQYKDFAQWQNRLIKSEEMRKQEEYWLQQFKEEIPVLNLPTDYPRPEIQSFAGGSIDFEINVEETKAWHELAKSEGATLFMLLTAIYNIFLSKLSGQEDIIIGTPIAGRKHADLENITGMFVNTLVLRSYPSGEKRFTRYLREVKEKTLQVFDNQDYQFEDLVENIVVERDASRNPLFDVMLILLNMLQPAKITEEEMGNLRVKPFVYERKTARFDLTLSAVEKEDRLSFRIGYCIQLFKKETVERFIRFFKNIMWSVVQAPGAKISGIEIISEEEKKQVLFDFNDTAAEYPGDKVIHQIFAEQAVRTPGKIALVGSRQYAIDKEEVQLTYGELDKRSDQLAALLKGKGIETGFIAAIMTEPIIEMIIGIMGVLKTGSCYLPLSPQTPRGRITYILEDSEARLVLTQLHPEQQVTFDVKTVNIDSESIYNADVHLPGTAGSPDDPVYMIYTSGTTGKPKGVLLKHGNLVNYVNWFSTSARLTPEDKTLLTASFAFDLGYTAVYPSLLTGAQLHILPREAYLLPESLLTYTCLKRISYLKMAPSQFAPIAACSLFSGETCRSLRLIVLGGEAINAADVEKAYGICPHLEIMNHYGPTEVTIGCIAQFIDIDQLQAYKTRPTIGKPIFNTNVFILDRYFNLLPVGIAGELCLSGAGVAKGYLKQESLTAERFITNRFRQREGAGPRSLHDRVYRTGDLARWLPDGNVEFLGRIDNQVKIRGFRIELGEIESRLLEHEDIKEAVVLVKKAAEEKYLAAYIASDREFDISQLREYLSGQLPEYMIPSHFAQVENIPLTANGKLDKRVLERSGTELGTGVQFEAPRNEMEEKIANIWREVLKLDRVGIHENFFDLGGTSLDLIKISTKLKEFLNEDEAVVQMFRYTTISSYARYLSQKSGGAESPDRTIDRTIQVDKIKKSRASQRNKRRGRVNV